MTTATPPNITTTTATATARQSDRAPATYTIFKQTDSGDWKQIAAQQAGRNAETALRAAVDKLTPGDQQGTFAAVPSRSWSPVKVARRTVTSLIVEDA